MEVFNKVFSQVTNSVSSTVSQLSGVLPGNPVTREFESSAHVASAGTGLLWKIYKGYKRSTRQEASIFVFEKRQLEKYNKIDREFILETLRRGVVQLTKIRHPKLLTVQHALEESRDSLAFATEPVFASLANVLGQTTNMPQPANMSDHKLFDVEIKYGLLQISEGLAFLHNDMKLLHKNIAPESIIINSQGAWKIFGLDFCVHCSNLNSAGGVVTYAFEEFKQSLPDTCQPNLNYLAPECVLSHTHSPASDMFSFGMLIYTLNAKEIKCLRSVKDVQQFKARVQELRKLDKGKLQCVPEELREFVKLFLNVSPDLRPDAHQFIKISYFDDVAVKTLAYLESLLQWDNLQKSQFYKGLPVALAKLPQRVKVQRVVACLVHDLSQPTMVPFILPSLFDIAQDCTQEEYCTYILPHIKPLMKLMEPIQILLIMLQRMELLLKLTPPEDIQQHVLPMLYRGLDCDSPQVHELCLAVLPTFVGLLNHTNVKNSLLPRIKKLCLNTSSLSVRVNCLLCVGKLLEHLDKWLVLDEVLPFLPQIPSREPAVLMGILGIYRIAVSHKKLGITKEIIASRVLPFLIPLCIENGLSIPQFNALTTLVKEMFQIVENEHRTKLEQLNSVRNERKELISSMPNVAPKSNAAQLDTAFSGLGLDSFLPGVNAQRKSNAVSQLGTEILEPQKSMESTDNSSMKTSANRTTSAMDDWISSSSNSSQPPVGQYIDRGNQNYKPTNGNGNFTAFNNQSLTNPLPLSKSNRNFTSSNLDTGSGVGQNFSSSHNPWSSNQAPNLNTSVSHNPWSGDQAFSKPQAAQNWSALDNLLPTNVSSANRTPMNMLSTQMMPLISSSNIANNNAPNKLSNQDLMDLLN